MISCITYTTNNPIPKFKGTPIQVQLQAVEVAPEVEAPHVMQRAPFDWSHANLMPLPAMLLDAQQRGAFTPQPDLPI